MALSENDYLKKFYSLLKDNLVREKKLNESVLVSFINANNSTRDKLLSDSIMPSNLIPNETLLSLLTQKRIQIYGDIGTYVITAKGIWDYEQSFGVLIEDNLLSYINEKFFSGMSSAKSDDLDDKEAIILFAMIAARAFSETSLVDLKKNDSVNEKWGEVLERSFDVLNNLNVIKKLKKEAFLVKSGNEDAVSSLFRHNGPAVEKTRKIYKYTHRYGYYLDVFQKDTFSKEKLSYLFWKIFQGSLSSDSADIILQFCKDISSKESIYLFDVKLHNFSMPSFDFMIKDSLLDSVLSKAKWAKV